MRVSADDIQKRAGRAWAAAVMVLLGGATANASDLAAQRENWFQQDVRPAIVQWCADCHDPDGAEADIVLGDVASPSQIQRQRSLWQRVVQKVRAGEMPPEDAEQPDERVRRQLTEAIERILTSVDCDCERQPGRVTIHRLNRVEYRNTIRDLLGVDYEPAMDFPADDVGYGFDNIADVLSLPPILLEKYLSAAEEVTSRAIVAEPQAPLSGQDDALPPSHRSILFVRPGPDLSRAEAARQVLERFATRAYRRPVRDEELDRLVALAERFWDRGETFERAIQVAVQAVLVSPHFLFRIEADPAPGELERTLNDYELATRLSYFLWSSMPDDELFEAARRGELGKPDILRGHVFRMLRSPRSQALVDNFAAQWLELRKFKTVDISQKDFPHFDETLRNAMARESMLFFEHIVREDRSILELLTGPYTFVNERLAQHYGLAGVEGEQFRMVSLETTPRRGVVTQGSVLTVTSNPTRTSPVKRGKWILENLLGEPPPAPPPNVPMLEEGPQEALRGTLRQRLEQHRANPACASCHQQMDALGFALENFDAVGAWREKDGSFAIDPSGELPDGSRFSGPRQLIDVLTQTRREAFLRCFTEKMLTYALGRGLEFYDTCVVNDIVEALEKDEYRFSTLVWEVVRSDPFRKRGAPIDQ